MESWADPPIHRDFAGLRPLNNLTVITPRDPSKTAAAAIWAASHVGPVFIHPSRTPVLQLDFPGRFFAAVANRRETLVVWDADTPAPICPAVPWQCRYTEPACVDLIAAGHDPAVVAPTGLGINAIFPVAKLARAMRLAPTAGVLHCAALGGAVDSWLQWKLTGGESFATDHSNASCTHLYDTQTLQFSPDLAAVFGLDGAVLAQFLGLVGRRRPVRSGADRPG